MKVKLFISQNLEDRISQIEETLLENDISKNHPDLLFFEPETKLGVEQAKQIRQFLAVKPYQAKGKAIAIINAHDLTPDAQNALLKTLEEPPTEAIILLGAEKESQLLATVLSRVEIIQIKQGLQSAPLKHQETEIKNLESIDYHQEIEKLQSSTIDLRFSFIEKLEEKEEFLKALTFYYREKLKDNPDNLEYLKKLVRAEEWANSNGNLRAILEYLMIELPKERK